jgi:choline dehydrogenase
MVYCRGTPSDYNAWVNLGNVGWSYDDVLPYFRRLETYHAAADQYHGDQGPLHISRPLKLHPLAQAWIEAGQQAGFKYNPDTNGAAREGFGPCDATVNRGRRCSSASAYLHPVLRRRNLRVVTDALAHRILLEGNRATGVEYVHKGERLQAHVDREVILSGGAINSPQLLMLSGIGDGDQLRRHGIKTRIELPGVGQDLQDHLASSVMFACLEPISLYNYLSPPKVAMALAQYLLYRGGPLARLSVEAIAFVRAHPLATEADAKMHFAMALYRRNGRELIKQHGFFAYIAGVRPRSRGAVRLRSADPTEPPLIDPNFFAIEDDRRALIEAIKIAREVFAQRAFDRYRGPELTPGPLVISDSEIEAHVRGTAEADYHSVGTCRMGNDSFAVVDSQLRVHGSQGLRVVDASVMPLIPGGNTNIPTVMVAERGSDMILGRSKAEIRKAA